MGVAATLPPLGVSTTGFTFQVLPSSDTSKPAGASTSRLAVRLLPLTLKVEDALLLPTFTLPKSAVKPVRSVSTVGVEVATMENSPIPAVASLPPSSVSSQRM